MIDEVAHRNIMAIKQYSEDTRKMVRELELKTNTITTLLNRINVMEKQIGSLLVKINTGGATA